MSTLTQPSLAHLARLRRRTVRRERDLQHRVGIGLADQDAAPAEVVAEDVGAELDVLGLLVTVRRGDRARLGQARARRPRDRRSANAIFFLQSMPPAFCGSPSFIGWPGTRLEAIELVGRGVVLHERVGVVLAETEAQHVHRLADARRERGLDRRRIVERMRGRGRVRARTRACEHATTHERRAPQRINPCRHRAPSRRG